MDQRFTGESLVTPEQEHPNSQVVLWILLPGNILALNGQLFTNQSQVNLTLNLVNDLLPWSPMPHRFLACLRTFSRNGGNSYGGKG